MSYAAQSMSDEEFESWRYVQDDEADAVAGALLDSPYAHDVYKAIGNIAKNNDEVTFEIFRVANPQLESNEEYDKVVKILQDYFNDMHRMPQNDAERATIRRGCEFFDLHVGDCLFALTLRSLLKQYAAARATNVLTQTKLLIEYPHRRMIETLQFVADVMEPNGFEPTGNGVRSIQKLRLVHAMIRHRINRRKYDPTSPDPTMHALWDESWGKPINQQDMIFAVHTFGQEVIDGLIAAGIKMSQQNIDDFYMTWHYYGRALGVKDELNPTSYVEGKKLQDRIYAKEFKANPNALVLTPPLIAFSRTLLPFAPSETHIYAMTKRFNDPKDYKPIFEEILMIPLSKAHLGWMWIYFAGEHILHFFGVVRRMFSSKDDNDRRDHYLAMRNQRLIQTVVNIDKTWSSKHFRIADGFGESASKTDKKEIGSEPNILQRLWRMITHGK